MAPKMVQSGQVNTAAPAVLVTPRGRAPKGLSSMQDHLTPLAAAHRCSRCHAVKPLGEFFRRSASDARPRSQCKACCHRTPTAVVVCEQCGQSFIPAWPGRRRFCSLVCAGLARRVPLAERLWSRVQRGGMAECWPWIGPRDRYGYGFISIGERRMDRTHRVAWRLSYGPILDGLFVCHRCDNPPCCNPAHLFLGTNADNVADMVAKDRQARGPVMVAGRRHRPYVQYPASLVVTICAAVADGASINSVALRYGLEWHCVRRIVDDPESMVLGGPFREPIGRRS